MSGLIGVSPNMKSGNMGMFPAGHILQCKSVDFNGIQTVTGYSYVQITNFSIDMACTHKNNKVVGMGTLNLSGSERYGAMRVAVDGTTTAFMGTGSGLRKEVTVSSMYNSQETNANLMNFVSSFTFEYAPGDTSSHTYTCNISNTNGSGNSNNVYINRGHLDENGAHTHRGYSSWIMMEVEV